MNRSQPSSPSYHVAANRRMSAQFRSVAKRIALTDFCVIAFLLLLGLFSIITLFILSPFILLLAARAFILLSFIRHVRNIDTVSMYSPFEFHRTDRLRQYARLTRHHDLSKWMLLSYGGLLVAIFVSGFLLIILAVLFNIGFLLLFANSFIIAAAAFSVMISIETLYSKAVVHNVEHVLCNEEMWGKYAASKSASLLQTSRVERNRYLLLRKAKARTSSGRANKTKSTHQ